MAETITVAGYDRDNVEAYFARPLGPGPYGGVVVIHHLPGYDEATKEIVRKFAANGYVSICPNLHYRKWPELSPDDASAAARAAGGVPDDEVLGDCAGATEYIRSLTYSNGKVGIIGFCSGGRQAFLAACSPDVLSLDAAVDCYGAIVGTWPKDHELSGTEPVVHLTPRLSAPLLGLFGAEDKRPSPDDVAQMEAVLKESGQTYEFHTYEGAGHAFFAVDRPAYRTAAAVDGWERIFGWLSRYLAT